MEAKSLSKQLKSLKQLRISWSYKKCMFCMYAGISLVSLSMANPSFFKNQIEKYFNVNLGSTVIEAKRNNELFFYSTALSI